MSTGSALTNAQWRPDAALGDEVPQIYRDDWDDYLVGGPGSDNIGLLGGFCELAYQQERNTGLYNAVDQAWANYTTLDLYDRECFSNFVYGDWIIGTTLAARQFATPSTSEDLLPLCRTFGVLLALTSSQERFGNGRWPGRKSIMAGARSWTEDEDGVPYSMLWSGDNPLGNLAAALFDDPDILTGMNDELSDALPLHIWWDVFTEEEEGRLLQLANGTLDAQTVQWAVDVLNEGPWPKITGRLIITEGGKIWYCDDSINPGSTCFLYAKAYYRGGRPAGWWTTLDYRDTDITFLPVDPPLRNVGISGHTREVDGQIQAQRRATNNYFDHNAWEYRPGWIGIPIPGGQELLRLSFGPNGAVAEYEGQVSPPPPANTRSRTLAIKAARNIANSLGVDPGPVLDLLRQGEQIPIGLPGIKKAEKLTNKALAKRLQGN